jgi:hypothetical protein
VGVGGVVVVGVVGAGDVVGVGLGAGVCAPAAPIPNSVEPATTLRARSAVSGR